MGGRDFDNLTDEELRCVLSHVSALLEERLLHKNTHTNSTASTSTASTSTATTSTASASTASASNAPATPTDMDTTPYTPSTKRPTSTSPDNNPRNKKPHTGTKPKTSKKTTPSTSTDITTSNRFDVLTDNETVTITTPNPTDSPKTLIRPALLPAPLPAVVSSPLPIVLPAPLPALPLAPEFPPLLPPSHPVSYRPIISPPPRKHPQDTSDAPSTSHATATTRNTATTNPTDNQQQIPPFVLRDKSSWTAVSQHLTKNNIHYTKATNARDGINIYTSTETQYRTLYKTLVSLGHQFHTYQLRSEKPLRVVIRGIIQEISTDEIQTDLLSQNYESIRVTRLNGKNNRPAPLVMVELDKRYKSIFNLTNLCGLSVTVESKHTPTGPPQCHKCQIFGHTQLNCHANYKCMKCAGPHSTHECPKPKTTPAQCANCNGEHPSTYSGCPQNPNKLRVPTHTQHASYSAVARAPFHPPAPSPSAPRAPPHSAPRVLPHVAALSNAIKANTPPTDPLGVAIQTLLENLLGANPSQTQLATFIQTSNTIFKLFHRQ